MKTTLATFFTKLQAEKAINQLREEGVPDSDISCLYTNEEGKLKDEETTEKVESGAATGAVTGGAIGVIAGLVVANGVLPGLGTLFVAGPLVTALGIAGGAATTVAGAATGAVAGGLVGALLNLGVKEGDAELYQKFVKKGDILLVVKSDSDKVMDVLLHSKAQEIREYP